MHPHTHHWSIKSIRTRGGEIRWLYYAINTIIEDDSSTPVWLDITSNLGLKPVNIIYHWFVLLFLVLHPQSSTYLPLAILVWYFAAGFVTNTIPVVLWWNCTWGKTAEIVCLYGKFGFWENCCRTLNLSCYGNIQFSHCSSF